jgi:hypothetical protein
MKRSQFLGMLIGLPFIGKMIGKEEIKLFRYPSRYYVTYDSSKYDGCSLHSVTVYKDQFQEVGQYVKTWGNSGYQWLRYPTTKREDGSYVYGELAGKLTKLWVH